MPSFRVATDTDMRRITSRNLEEIDRLPHLYIPDDQAPGTMRQWGVAHERSLADFARLYPGSLVAPTYQGALVDRGDLLYHDAEPAEAFRPPAKEPGTWPAGNFNGGDARAVFGPRSDALSARRMEASRATRRSTDHGEPDAVMAL